MTTARDLARRYDEYVSALWRGDTLDAQAFSAWIESFWGNEGPPEPTTCPDALSILGGGGAGIRWYAKGATILGYVPGRPRGCYQVPVSEAPPMVVLYPPAATVDIDQSVNA